MDENRPGLDLIISIDTSGSMSGQKIQLVKETLEFLVKELKPIDRLALVEFNSSEKVLAGFNPITEENKKKYLEIIKNIKAGGSTNIKASIKRCLDMMLARKESNEVTSLLFLSDGQDTCGQNENTMRVFMNSYNGKFAKKKMDFQTHSFGYGEGHDEKILKAISDHKNGNFYYIKNNKIVDECFLDCMGKLMTVIGQKGKI